MEQVPTAFGDRFFRGPAGDQRAPIHCLELDIEAGFGQCLLGYQCLVVDDRLVVRRLEDGEQTVGGIIIPDSAKEKPQEGEVIAVGAGKREKGELIALDVKPGDRVLFGKYSGTEIKLEGEELLILREEEILAKLSGAAKAAKK